MPEYLQRYAASMAPPIGGGEWKDLKHHSDPQLGPDEEDAHRGEDGPLTSVPPDDPAKAFPCPICNEWIWRNSLATLDLYHFLHRLKEGLEAQKVEKVPDPDAFHWPCLICDNMVEFPLEEEIAIQLGQWAAEYCGCARGEYEEEEGGVGDDFLERKFTLE